MGTSKTREEGTGDLWPWCGGPMVINRALELGTRGPESNHRSKVAPHFTQSSGSEVNPFE